MDNQPVTDITESEFETLRLDDLVDVAIGNDIIFYNF